MQIFSYQSVLTYVLGAQKNRLIETVLLCTHNICFGWEMKKLNFRYALLTQVLELSSQLIWICWSFQIIGTTMVLMLFIAGRRSLK